MRRLFTGTCSRENIFEIRDPAGLTESEFESWVVKGLLCMFQSYHCVVFSGGFSHEGIIFRPDLALVAQDYSHWFIVEVELTSHSLREHVLPQVCGFRYGAPVQGCAKALADSLGVHELQGRTLLERVPYGVAVIINRDNPEWEVALRAHDIQVLVVSSYSSTTGLEAIEVNSGQYLEVVRESRWVWRICWWPSVPSALVFLVSEFLRGVFRSGIYKAISAGGESLGKSAIRG